LVLRAKLDMVLNLPTLQNIDRRRHDALAALPATIPALAGL
jgi:hypothetical protein